MVLISQIRFFWLIQNECIGFDLVMFIKKQANIKTMAITLYLIVLKKENVVLVIVGFLILTYTLTIYLFSSS